jgi:hypothetical protein
MPLRGTGCVPGSANVIWQQWLHAGALDRKMHVMPRSSTSPFPRRGLVAPPLVPLTVVAIAWLIGLAGHQWNPHGDAILVFLLAFGSGGVAVVSSLVFLVVAVQALRSRESLRTPANITCTFFAAVYVVVAIVGFLVVSRGVHAI